MLIVGLASLMSWRITRIHQPQLGRRAHLLSKKLYCAIFFASISESSGWCGMCHGPASWIHFRPWLRHPHGSCRN